MEHSSLFETLLLIGASFVLVALNGFFVAAEFAIVKVRRTRLEELQGQGVKSARATLILVDQLDEYLSATQLGITLVSLGLGWIGEPAFGRLLSIAFPFFDVHEGARHGVAVAIAFSLITLLHVVLGELVPKSMAIQNAEKIALWISRPLRFFYIISKPLILAFTKLATFFLRLLGYHGLEEPPLSEQELQIVMKESREEGVITESEAKIINRAFSFSDKRAIDIMVPKEEVIYISLSRTIEENIETMKRTKRSRLPVCFSGFSTVMGFIHVKDVWPILCEERDNDVFKRCTRAAIFVDPSTREDKIMDLFQKKGSQFAVVRDSKRGYLGVVTFEDVIEELVGEIRDEHEEPRIYHPMEPIV